VVAYVNCSAAVKAEADYLLTSGTRSPSVRSLRRTCRSVRPGLLLGSYLRRVTGRDLDVWMGECHVHAALTPDVLAAQRSTAPRRRVRSTRSGVLRDERDVLPESTATSGRAYGDRLHRAMMRRARTSSAREFVVATETGVLHRLRRENPTKPVLRRSRVGECRYMKMITLEKLRTRFGT